MVYSIRIMVWQNVNKKKWNEHEKSMMLKNDVKTECEFLYTLK